MTQRRSEGDSNRRSLQGCAGKEAVAATGVVIIRRGQYRLKPWSGDDPADVAQRLQNQSDRLPTTRRAAIYADVSRVRRNSV